MNPSRVPRVGSMPWRDLTVPDAERIRAFFAEVVGWPWRAEDMGGCRDSSMMPPDGADPVAGARPARGPNRDVPPRWRVHIVVEDVDGSAARAAEPGGALRDGPRAAGGGTFALVRDPAGKAFALCAAAGA
uniref:VOC family protein n=1 Tax=Eiseniibacteriota bacterium TaxID=2212470 RepID=A0A832MMV0_UNCEI